MLRAFLAGCEQRVQDFETTVLRMQLLFLEQAGKVTPQKSRCVNEALEISVDSAVTLLLVQNLVKEHFEKQVDILLRVLDIGTGEQEEQELRLANRVIDSLA